ncbi:MAG: hypothetical protein MI922_16665, partial [Bacteroidales bacterium]|nr:hypothetical protein [Bacteroidales bacterium]
DKAAAKVDVGPWKYSPISVTIYLLSMAAAFQVKEYYSKLTGIIRAYIEMHFEIPALEQTTSEILKSFYDSEYRQIINRNDLEELLNLADLVKFAKGDPQPDENIKLLEIGYKFIKETKDIFKKEEDEQEDSESFKNIKESK